MAEKKDPMEYIRAEAPSWTQPEYEVAGEWDGVLSDSPINLVFYRKGGGYVKSRGTMGGSFVQEFHADGTPATKIRAYRRREEVCHQCQGTLGDDRREVIHFFHDGGHGGDCLGHPVCSASCEEAFNEAEQEKFPPPLEFCEECGRFKDEQTSLCPLCKQ